MVYCFEVATIEFTDISGIDNAFFWEWTFQGGTKITSSVQNPTITFFQPGTYTVTLALLDIQGAFIIAQSNEIVIVEEMPEASFTTEITGPIVYFSNTSTNNSDSFHWNFGDGNTSDEPAPFHVFYETGIYEVTLTATNECGSVTSTQMVEGNK